jgi:lipopolysaccharide export system protein LptA
MRTPHHTSSEYLLLVISVLCIGVPSWATRESATLILRSANYNENSLVDNQLVSTLRGNVIFEYDDMTIKADYARWWRKTGTVNLTKNIVVKKQHQNLTCDWLQFRKSRKQLVASGDVFLRDEKDHLQVSGRRGTYNIETKRILLTGEPKFIRYDTTAAESLKISGERMEYDDSLKTTSVYNNVDIEKGKLAAQCNRAVYFVEDDLAHLREQPNIIYDVHTLEGDSVNLYFDGDTLSALSVSGNANGVYSDFQTDDTSKTTVIGDSIFMSITPRGYLDTVWTVGNVESEQYRTSEPNTINEVSGNRMVLAFDNEGTIQQVRITGNATSSYWMVEDVDNPGRNEASGDSLYVFFKDGKTSRLRLSGSVRGAYYPESM